MYTSSFISSLLSFLYHSLFSSYFLLFSFIFPPFFIVLFFHLYTKQILSFFIWIITGHSRLEEIRATFPFNRCEYIITRINSQTNELVNRRWRRRQEFLTWFFFNLSASTSTILILFHVHHQTRCIMKS